MARVNLRSKGLLKKILSVILAIGIGLGSVIGITALVSKIAEDDLKTVRPIFKVGSLDDSTGEYVKGTSTVYSAEFECQGLLITPKFESKVSYKVFYYDTNKDFLGKTELLSDVYMGVPNDENLNLGSKSVEDVKYARILIYPEDDAKIYWYEVIKYSTALKIEVYKDQETTPVNPSSVEESSTINDTTYNN